MHDFEGVRPTRNLNGKIAQGIVSMRRCVESSMCAAPERDQQWSNLAIQHQFVMTSIVMNRNALTSSTNGNGLTDGHLGGKCSKNKGSSELEHFEGGLMKVAMGCVSCVVEEKDALK